MLTWRCDASGDWEMLTIFAEDMESDPGWVKIVRMTRIVASLVPGHSSNTQGGAGGGGRVLHLDHAGARDQVPVVLPHHVLGAHDGGADHTLQLQGAVLLHIDVRTSKYSHLQQIFSINIILYQYHQLTFGTTTTNSIFLLILGTVLT